MMALQRACAAFMIAIARRTPATRGGVVDEGHADAVSVPAGVFWWLWLSLAATFAAFAWAATRGYRLPLDQRATFAVQDLSRFRWVDGIFARVNDAGSYEVVGGLLVVSALFCVARGLRFEALVIAGAGAAHYGQEAVKALVHRPEYAGVPFPGHLVPATDGFPSGHVFGEVLVYGLIFAYISRVVPIRGLTHVVRLACGLEILLGGPARMYTGAHWMSDVFGAALLAAIYLTLVWRVDRSVAELRAAGSGGLITAGTRAGIASRSVAAT